MRKHFEIFWGLYVIAAVCVAMITLVVIAEKIIRDEVAYCYDQGMILVDTDAGKRCAPLHSMGAAS